MTTAPVAPAAATAPETLGGLLERAAELSGTGLRFVDRRERESFHTWAEVHQRARSLAAGLAELGVERGERVVLVLPTGAEFFDAFFGILLAGGVPVPLYPPVRLGRLDEYHRRTSRMIELAGARLVLADRRVRRILGETVELAGPAFGCRTLADLPPAAGRFSPPPVAAADLALVQFSSGTTVEPKPVALSHRAVLAQARLLNSFWPDGEGADEGVRHSGVSWLPLYHDMGLIGCVFPALERPADLTLLPPEAFVVRPALWLRALSRHRATISPAPNFAYGLCVHKVRDEEMEGVDLSSWYGALNGAEPVAPDVLRAFQRRFARWGLRPEALTPVYGLSEAALAVTFSPLGEPFNGTRFERRALTAEGVARPLAEGDGRAGRSDRRGVELVSVGRPLPGFQVRVLPRGGDEERPPAPGETEPLAEDRVGRVWVRGPSLMDGYLGRPEATARALVGGWLDTGDLGFLHRGDLYLTGRAKDVVILRGRNHSPAEIEDAAQVEGVRRGCAVAVSHLPADGGADSERLLLFVEADREADGELRAALPDACHRAVLAATGLATDEVIVLDPGTLPRTSSGKLRRGETLARHLAGTLRPPAAVNALRLVGEMARSGLAFARAGLARRRRPAAADDGADDGSEAGGGDVGGEAESGGGHGDAGAADTEGRPETRR
jgi:acyl-CoA synthetase (AMP-forming)/AMP-acid ligase II